MDPIRIAIRQPHLVAVATILILIFGIISLRRIPLQMRPTIDKPEITVSTSYPGASPQEVEDKITRPVEEMLNAVEGLKRMSSVSGTGVSRVSLEFDWGVNRDAAMVEVLNKLSRVRDLPDEADRPMAEAITSDTTSPIMWVSLRSSIETVNGDAKEMRTLLEDVIEPRIRRIDGVGGLIKSGGELREIQIVVDLKKLALQNIPLATLIAAVRLNNRTVRGGPMDSGKREYVVWTSGRAETLRTLAEMVIRREPGGVVTLSDVATIKRGHKRRDSIMRMNGRSAVAIGILRKATANVPKTARKVEAVIASLNKEFRQKKIPFQLTVMFTEVTYIDQAVSLVWGNLFAGAGLAVLVLLVFLGSWRSVFVIALSIPVSVVAVFLMIDLFGRSLNIISLAGLAFAVGMVVDNAIVVLEKIYSGLGRRDLSMEEICHQETRDVALAVLASTLTTVAVFLPIVFLSSEAGQIFKDIALGISFAVAFSFFTALTLIPTLAHLILRPEAREPGRIARLIGAVGSRFSALYRAALYAIVRPEHAARRLAVVIVVVAGFVLSLSLLPPTEYLPNGNRPMIITIARQLPGTSLETVSESVRPLEAYLLKQKEVQRIFVIFTDRFSGIGTTLKDQYGSEQQLEAFLSQMRRKTSQIAGFRYLFPMKGSIFRDPGKQFEVEIYGPDLKRLSGLADLLGGQLRQLDGVISVRSDFESGALNVEVHPRTADLAQKGLKADTLSDAVQVALGGLQVGYFLDQGREIDLTLIGDGLRYRSVAELRGLPLVTPAGKLFYLRDVGEVVEAPSPTQINRREMSRSITLTVNLSAKASLGDAISRVEQVLLKPLRAVIPSDYTVGLGETADKLNDTLSALSFSTGLAVVICYLLMVALFRSFWYPFVITTTLPMAASGAFLAIGISGAPFDTITMLGFIILAGIVVNNAILIVHEVLSLQREGMPAQQALVEGSQSRLRPIFMTATTTVLGMLPLALGTGAGTELYRGLGLAIVGGLSLSTLVTLFLVPALMALTDDFRYLLLRRPRSL